MLGPDTRDSALIPAQSKGWFGVNDRLKPALLAPEELAELVNGRLDDTGEIALRPGTSWLDRPTTAPIRGMHYFDTPEIEALIVCAAGKLFALGGLENATPATEISGVTTAGSTPVQMASLVDRLYLCDGNTLQELVYSGGWQKSTVGGFSDGTPLPRFRRICAAGFRVWGVGGHGTDADTVYCSSLLNGKDWLRVMGTRVGKGNGDPVETILPGPENTVIVLKEGSCWSILPQGQVWEWQTRAITMQRGCLAGATAVAVNQDVYFLTRDGVANLARLANDAPVAPVDLLSAPISGTIARINWPTAKRTACAGLWNEYYLLAVPLDGANDNNAVLCYNTKTGRWSGFWSGWTPAGFCQTEFGGRKETVLGDAFGALRRIDPDTPNDATDASEAAPIPFTVTGRAEAFDAADLWKQPVWGEWEFRGSTAEADIALRIDGGAPQIVREDFPTTPQAGSDVARCTENLRPISAGRQVQVKITTAGGAIRIREWVMKAFLLRGRWQPPPAELLLPRTLPWDGIDDSGQPVAVRRAPGAPQTQLLVEVASLTLGPNTDFQCFLGGADLMPGSYLLVYDRGAHGSDVGEDG